MKKFTTALKNHASSAFVGLAFSAFFIAASVQAASTISTNLQTDGTLSVTGQSSLIGNVGIGTTSPTGRLHVEGGSAVTSPTDSAVQISGGNIYLPNAATINFGNIAKSTFKTFVTRESVNNGFEIGSGGGTPVIYLDSANRIAFGRYTSGARAAIGSVASISFQDQTASTGVTNVVIRAGAGQGASALLAWQDNAGTNLGIIDGLGRIGVGVSSLTASLQVATSTTNATSTVEIGKTGQNKGSCLVMYDAAGTVQYVSIQGGSFVISSTSCR